MNAVVSISLRATVTVTAVLIGFTGAAHASEVVTEPLPTGQHVQPYGNWTTMEVATSTTVTALSWDVTATVLDSQGNPSTVTSVCSASAGSLTCPGLGSSPMSYYGQVGMLDIYYVNLSNFGPGVTIDGSTAIEVEPEDATSGGVLGSDCVLESDDTPECNQFCQERHGETCSGVAVAVNIGGCDMIDCDCTCPNRVDPPTFRKVDYEPEDPCYGRACTPQPMCCE